MATDGTSTLVEPGAELPTGGRETLARALALFCVVLVATSRFWSDYNYYINDATLALFGLLAVVMARNGRVDGLGLNVTPSQGWLFWCRFSLWIALAIGLVSLPVFAILWFGRFQYPIPRADPRRLLNDIRFMLVYSPVLEELVFRSLLCFALRPSLGFRATVAASGIIFALIHWPGNPGPDNQLAGFCLAYAFMRSQSLAVPITMHAAGNSVALMCHLISWYVLPATTP